MKKCPRCGEFALDQMRTHMFCIECGWSPDFDPTLQPNIILPEVIALIREDDESFKKVQRHGDGALAVEIEERDAS